MRRVVNQLIVHGKVSRPTLGVNVADDQQVRALSQSLRRQLDGVLVMEVVRGGPASQAGLQPTRRLSNGELSLGDLITSVGGTPIRQVRIAGALWAHVGRALASGAMGSRHKGSHHANH